MNRTLWGASIAVALALSLSACGGGSSTSAGTTKPGTSSSTASTTPADVVSALAGASQAAAQLGGSACKLVTADEVSTAAGQAMAVSGDGGAICVYSAVADASFTVYVQLYSDVPSQAQMTQLETAGSEHLDGLGDDAFWNGTAGIVFVRQGNRAFSFALPSLANLTTSPDAIKAKMVALAQGAFGRFSGGTSAPTSTPAFASANTSSAPAGSAAAPAADGSLHSCTLVSAQDASTAIGSTVGAGDEKNVGSASRCVYGDGSLVINAVSGRGKAFYDQERSAIKGAPVGSWKDVSGVGDGAFEITSGPMASMAFYKANTTVTIILTGSGATAPVEAAVTVAKAAAARL